MVRRNKMTITDLIKKLQHMVAAQGVSENAEVVTLKFEDNEWGDVDIDVTTISRHKVRIETR